MRFYRFDQNNVGGGYIGHQQVFIQAESAEQANAIAVQNGIYFDGCQSGIDCRCCGDRWSRAWDWEDDIYDARDIANAIRRYGRSEVRIIVRGG